MFDVAEYERKLKEINYKDIESIAKHYRWASSMSYGGWRLPLDNIKKMFPNECKIFASVFNKRVVVKHNIEFMQWVNESRLRFGTLTWSTDYDNMTESNKRKQAWRFLNQYFDMVLVVEEHGTKNTKRYHVHFVGLFKKKYINSDMTSSWHSYSYCANVRNIQKATRYVCDYVVKSVPRIRRNKALVYGFNQWKDVERQYQNVYSGCLPIENEKWKKYQNEIELIAEDLPF